MYLKLNSFNFECEVGIRILFRLANNCLNSLDEIIVEVRNKKEKNTKTNDTDSIRFHFIAHFDFKFLFCFETRLNSRQSELKFL